MELLILLVQRQGELVSREEIADRLWGKDVFVDIDHSINTAVRKIRFVLRDDPDKPRFVETVVGKGYRFAAPVTGNNGSSKTLPVIPLAEEPALAEAPGRPESRVLSAQKKVPAARLWLLLGVATVLAVLAVTLVVSRGRNPKSTSQPPINSLAVLPLKNLSGDSTQEYLADGMTEELIGRLSAVSQPARCLSHISHAFQRHTALSSGDCPNTRSRCLG